MDYEPGDSDHPDPQKALRPDSVEDFDEQDWMIIIEALSKWHMDELFKSEGTGEIGTPRGGRAVELAAVIGDEKLGLHQTVLNNHGFPDEVVDERWPVSQLE